MVRYQITTKLGKDTGETRERGGGVFTDFCSWNCASRTSNFDFRYTIVYLSLSQKAGTNTYNMSM